MNGAEGDEVMEAPTVSVGTVGINSKHCHGGNLASYEEEEECLACILELCIHILPPTLNKDIPAKCLTLFHINHFCTNSSISRVSCKVVQVTKKFSK